jgi:hypothetical protein
MADSYQADISSHVAACILIHGLPSTECTSIIALLPTTTTLFCNSAAWQKGAPHSTWLIKPLLQHHQKIIVSA